MLGMGYIRGKIAGSWLRRMNQCAQRRIDAGDLDFDDTTYRTREASAILLDIWF